MYQATFRRRIDAFHWSSAVAQLRRLTVAYIDLDDQRIEYFLTDGSSTTKSTIVFLHEGLGSVALWKDFPRNVALATGCGTLVYSRRGYGFSTSLSLPREPDFMHAEALNVLPKLLDALQIVDPILFGHSDGASIALINAGNATRRLRGLIVMAPHVMVEEICIDSIGAVRRIYDCSDMREKLGRYHADPEGAFRGWCNIWLDPRFRAWNIEEYLPTITCPVLAIQGFDDEYGTMEQLDRIAQRVPSAEILKLQSCGHSPHRDQPDAVISAITRYINCVRNLPLPSLESK